MIEKIALHECSLKGHLGFSYGLIEQVNYFFICLQAGGIEGWGEAISLFGEELFIEWPEAIEVSQSLIGKDPCYLEALLPPVSEEKTENALREGLDIALHDLIGRRHALPVHTLLGGMRQERVPLMPTVLLKSPSQMAEDVADFVRKGFRFVKIKASGQEEDVYVIEKVRQETGREFILQADVNEGYKTVDEAVRAIRKMERVGLDLVEDPAEVDLAGYAEIRRKVGAKIVLDVRSRPSGQLYRALQVGAADVINLHPNQLGGLREALRLSALARAGGCEIMVGGNGYLGIADAAFQSLAAVVCRDYPCEESGSLDRWGINIVRETYPIQEGYVWVMKKPGLGVEVDLDKLKKIVTRQEVLTS